MNAVHLWKDPQGVKDVLNSEHTHPTLKITLSLELEHNKPFFYLKKGVAGTHTHTKST